jgi:hypothetical protein
MKQSCNLMCDDEQADAFEEIKAGEELEGALPQLSIEFAADQHRDLVSELQSLDPIKTACTFGGLLMRGELQANCLRLEVLVHVSLAFGKGNDLPSKAFIERSFKALSTGTCGLMEDPAEDVFVSLVNTPEGNFRVLEGIRESTGFHLQRILKVLETMPAATPFDEVRTSIAQLLKLSDALVQRAGLREYSLGDEWPHVSLPPALTNTLSLISDLVVFTENDLNELKITSRFLSDFIFNAAEAFRLKEDVIGNSKLERRPILKSGDAISLVLPTAVGSAITLRVIEFVTSLGLVPAFEKALAAEFTNLFKKTPLFGGRLSPSDFCVNRIEGGRIGSLLKEVDRGRFLHLIFFVDSLEEFSNGGLGGINAKPDLLGKAIEKHIESLSAESRQSSGFVEGITVLVACGVGRAIVTSISRRLPDSWSFETIGAADFLTLSWTSDFRPLSLFRILAARQVIEDEGTALVNVNGLINLVAISKQLAGHLVAHAQMADDFAERGPDVIVLEQNALRLLRHQVMVDWDARRILDIDKTWVQVKRLRRSAFDEDRSEKLYTSEEDVMAGRLRAAYLAPRRPWWVELKQTGSNREDSAYQHWEMLCLWVRRLAPVLDDAYPGLAAGPLLLLVDFEKFPTTGPTGPKPKKLEELRLLVQRVRHSNSRILELHVAAGFEDGFLQAQNVAERVLVEALVKVVADVSGEEEKFEKEQLLLSKIIPNDEARHIHRFETQSFRDYVRLAIPSKPIVIDDIDQATNKIGLGWRVQARNCGPEILGTSACTSYLNKTVSLLMNGLKVELSKFNRSELIMQALSNHEAALMDATNWQRTTQAMLALRNDKAAAR